MTRARRSSRPTPAACRARAGYTLVEVLAAMVMLAVILPVAMEGVSLAMALGSSSRRTAQAAVLARAKLDELAVTGNWQTKQLAGDFSPDYPDYKWTAVVQDFDGGTVMQLDVQVTWTARQRERSIVMSTLVTAAASQTTTPQP